MLFVPFCVFWYIFPNVGSQLGFKLFFAFFHSKALNTAFFLSFVTTVIPKHGKTQMPAFAIAFKQEHKYQKISEKKYERDQRKERQKKEKERKRKEGRKKLRHYNKNKQTKNKQTNKQTKQ